MAYSLSTLVVCSRLDLGVTQSQAATADRLRRGSTEEQPREPAGSVARRPPSRRARTTVPSRAAHERCGPVPRESPLHLHFHQAEICTGRAPQLHAVCLAHIRRCKRTAAERAARLVVELVGEAVLAQAAPARTRALSPNVARSADCKPLRRVLPPPREAAAAAAAARPNLYACASAGPAGCAACTACCNTVQHGATCCNAAQRVCVAPATVPVPQDARPARCVRHGKANGRRRSRTGASVSTVRNGARGEYSGCIGISKRRQAVGCEGDGSHSPRRAGG